MERRLILTGQRCFGSLGSRWGIPRATGFGGSFLVAALRSDHTVPDSRQSVESDIWFGAVLRLLHSLRLGYEPPTLLMRSFYGLFSSVGRADIVSESEDCFPEEPDRGLTRG